MRQALAAEGYAPGDIERLVAESQRMKAELKEAGFVPRKGGLKHVPMPSRDTPEKPTYVLPKPAPRIKCRDCRQSVAIIDSALVAHGADGQCEGSGKVLPPATWYPAKQTTEAEAADRHSGPCPKCNEPTKAGEWSRVRRGPGVFERYHDDCAEDAGAPQMAEVGE